MTPPLAANAKENQPIKAEIMPPHAPTMAPVAVQSFQISAKVMGATAHPMQQLCVCVVSVIEREREREGKKGGREREGGKEKRERGKERQRK